MKIFFLTTSGGLTILVTIWLSFVTPPSVCLVTLVYNYLFSTCSFLNGFLSKTICHVEWVLPLHHTCFQLCFLLLRSRAIVMVRASSVRLPLPPPPFLYCTSVLTPNGKGHIHHIFLQFLLLLFLACFSKF